MKQFHSVPRLALVSSLLIFAGACNYPTATPVTTQEIVTAVVGTLTAEASRVPQPTAAPDILPHSLYFLSERGGSAQVWRLERDGMTTAQLTDEPSGVDDFDVSPSDGTLAYVSGNQMFVMESDGQPTLLLDNHAASVDLPDYYYNQLIKAPRFSSDGSILAYALDGIFFYHLDNGKTEHILPNELDTRDDGSVLAKELYIPLEWSPDGAQLLIDIAHGEGSLLAVLHPGGDPLLTRLQANGSFCCQVAWAPDSRSVLVASPYLGLVDSGFWRYDARTGGETTLIDSFSEGLYNFAGWPLQLDDGNLIYFYTSSTEIPEGDVGFFVVRSTADAVSNRNQLRPESFNLHEALWSEDGSLVLVVQNSPDGGRNGPVVLVYSDGRPLQGLLDDARQLKWGP